MTTHRPKDAELSIEQLQKLFGKIGRSISDSKLNAMHATKGDTLIVCLSYISPQLYQKVTLVESWGDERLVDFGKCFDWLGPDGLMRTTNQQVLLNYTSLSRISNETLEAIYALQLRA